MTTPAIRVEGLGKRYRLTQGQQREGYRTLRESLGGILTAPFRKKGSVEEFWALDDVSFEVQPGEVVGVIGRNGAGKSTLLKILSRITKPTRGRIDINGRVGSLLEVGTGFHPELTGRENVYLNGSILGMSRQEITAKFDEIVAFAEVEKFLDTPVKRYSSGMYVRLAFAVAAHLEPEILIVDEVLAVGDAEFQKKCLGKMGDFAKSGRTVLFVSHQMSAVQSLCSHAVLMQKGKVLETGPKSQIVAAYINMSSRAGMAGEWIDLDTGKTGEGKTAWFSKIKIQSHELAAAFELFPDGSATFTFVIEAATNVSAIFFSIVIYDRFDTRLVDFNTSRCLNSLSLAKGTNEFVIKAESLHLNPGQYKLGVWMADGNEVLDQNPNAATIKVVEYFDQSTTNGFAVDGMVSCSFACQKSRPSTN